MKTPLSLRDKKKLQTRRALVAAAARRFGAQGFAATTIEDICADVGISKRTCFRYFADKEALAFPQRQARLRRFLDLLQQAPADEHPLASLRRITRLFALEYAQQREALLAQHGLVQGEPSLLAREREIDGEWEAGMAGVFQQRFGPGAAAALRARVLAGAVMGVVRATRQEWFAQAGVPDLSVLGGQALDWLERGFLDSEAQ